MKTLEQVNALKSAEFEKAFGDVAEHSPWVARNAEVRGRTSHGMQWFQLFAMWFFRQLKRHN